MDYLKVQTSREATLSVTGFLLLFRGKSGSGECGFLLGALFVEGDMVKIGFLWLLSGERGVFEYRLVSGLPSYFVASGAVAGILA